MVHHLSFWKGSLTRSIRTCMGCHYKLRRLCFGKRFTLGFIINYIALLSLILNKCTICFISKNGQPSANELGSVFFITLTYKLYVMWCIVFTTRWELLGLTWFIPIGIESPPCYPNDGLQEEEERRGVVVPVCHFLWLCFIYMYYDVYVFASHCWSAGSRNQRVVRK